jgi:hypothetical protein
MELISGFVTAPSTTQTNLTMATGDSLAIRAHDDERQARAAAPGVDG